MLERIYRRSCLLFFGITLLRSLTCTSTLSPLTAALDRMRIPESAVKRVTTTAPMKPLTPQMTSTRRLMMHKSPQLTELSVLHQLKKLAADKIKLPSSTARAAVQHVKDDELRALGITPIVAMINKKSGGGAGKKLLHILRTLLHDVQVCDVHSQQGSSTVLAKYKECVDNMKLLVCGGDGTVSRVIDDLYQLNMSRVPIGLIAAGTGNDLVNALSSTYFKPETPVLTVESVRQAPTQALAAFANPQQCEIDIWNIKRYDTKNPRPQSLYSGDINPAGSTKEEHIQVETAAAGWLKNKRFHLRLPKPVHVYPDRTLVNYFSLGVDSHVSLDFDALRQLRPRLFVSQLVNKVWYGILGIKVFLQQPELDLSMTVSMECDGVPVTVPPGTKGIVFLNVDSYAGGSKIWPQQDANTGTGRWKKSSAEDGQIEVVALEGILHLGAIKSGLASATRIAQGRSVRLVTKQQLPMQVDGEPFVQPPCSIHVDRKGSARFMIPSGAPSEQEAKSGDMT